jgi:hypothetical protein
MLQEVGIWALIYTVIFVCPCAGLIRGYVITTKLWRGFVVPRSTPAFAFLAVGLAGYLLLGACLVGFWGFAAFAAFRWTGSDMSPLVPISYFAALLFPLGWALAELLIYVGYKEVRPSAADPSPGV